MNVFHVILGAPKKERIKPLIHKTGVVIGVDRGALYAIDEEIELDIALGDFDSISSKERNIIEKYAKKVIFDGSEEYTDTEITLKYIIDNFEPEKIYIYNWSGGRVDHLYSLLMLPYQKKFKKIITKIHFVSESNYITYYSPGNYEINKINKMKYLSFISLLRTKALTINNVKYPINNKNFNYPQALISNQFIKKTAFLSFKEGLIATIQSKD